MKYVLHDRILAGLRELDLEFGRGPESGSHGITTRESRKYIVRSIMEEAISSSRIEGATTTRQRALEMLRAKRNPRDLSERMILNNFRAMEKLEQFAERPLSVELLCDLHRSLTEGTLEDARDEGRLRGAGDLIEVVNAQGRVVHEPPRAADLSRHLKDLCAFANDTSKEPFHHPVLRAVFLHYAVAYVHPFVDGNGRLARALFYWEMLRSGYWITRYLSISQAIFKKRNAYYRAYLETETDGNDLTYFALFHVEALLDELKSFLKYLTNRGRELAELEDEVRALRRLNHRQRELILQGLRQASRSYTMKEHASVHGVSIVTAREDLIGLVEFGLMEREASRNPNRFFFQTNLDDRLRSLSPEE